MPGELDPGPDKHSRLERQIGIRDLYFHPCLAAAFLQQRRYTGDASGKSPAGVGICGNNSLLAYHDFRVVSLNDVNHSRQRIVLENRNNGLIHLQKSSFIHKSLTHDARLITVFPKGLDFRVRKTNECGLQGRLLLSHLGK